MISGTENEKPRYPVGITGNIWVRRQDFDLCTSGYWLEGLDDPPPNRHALSKELYRRIGWFKPHSGLKAKMTRVTMLAMHEAGLIILPPPKWTRPPRRPMVFAADTKPPLFTVPTALD